jgi:cation transport regulator ChaC
MNITVVVDRPAVNPLSPRFVESPWETRPVMEIEDTWVFGYGSLVDLRRLAVFLGRELTPEDIAHGHLQGFRRTWNVATDNRLDLPGYKMYLDPETGERPEVFVTFLNLRPVVSGEEVNGIALRVTERELARIRDREHNYRLAEVTDRWRPEDSGRELPGRLVTSLGRPEAEARFREGRQTGRAVVRSHYRRLVHSAYGQRGRTWWEQYCSTTDAPGIAERALERVELP